MSNVIRYEPVETSPQPYHGHERDSLYGQRAAGESSLSEYLRVIIRRKWLILATILTVLSAVTLETFTTTPVFKSSAVIRIDPETANVLPYKQVYEPDTGGLESMETQQRVLQSRTVAKRVMRRLNLAANPVFHTQADPGFLSRQFQKIFGLGRSKDAAESADLVDRLLEQTEVAAIKNSRLLQTSCLSTDPQLATQLVNTLANEFIEHNLESRFLATAKATEFLQKQLQDLQISVEKSEEELFEYARANGILNLDEKQNIVTQTLADLNREKTRVESELISKRAQYAPIRHAKVENFPSVLKNETILKLEDRLSVAQQNLASLSTQFGPEWPSVLQAQQEIGELKKQLSIAKAEALERARLDYSTTEQHYQMVARALEEQKDRVNRFNENSIQYSILKREAETNKQVYEELLQRMKQAAVSAGLKSSNIQIVDPGEIPRQAFRPKKIINVTVGLILGLIAGMALALLLERVDSKIRTGEDVEQFLALPSLGLIPRVAGSQNWGSALPHEPGESGRGLLNDLDSRSPLWEHYRLLRTSITLSNVGRGPRTILVTSALPGEGKTTTAANMGITLAHTGARTLLIDLDMRKPSLGYAFGLNGGKGISTFLTRESDLASQIRQTIIPNLYVIPAGATPSNSAELIGSERMRRALALLSLYFEYIVIDMPPILAATDALVLSPYVDGVMLVVWGGKTHRAVVKRAAKYLSSVNARILGAVVNKAEVDETECFYYPGDYYQEQSKQFHPNG